jgi:hypothetical protein
MARFGKAGNEGNFGIVGTEIGGIIGKEKLGNDPKEGILNPLPSLEPPPTPKFGIGMEGNFGKALGAGGLL